MYLAKPRYSHELQSCRNFQLSKNEAMKRQATDMAIKSLLLHYGWEYDYAFFDL